MGINIFLVSLVNLLCSISIETPIAIERYILRFLPNYPSNKRLDQFGTKNIFMFKNVVIKKLHYRFTTQQYFNIASYSLIYYRVQNFDKFTMWKLCPEISYLKYECDGVIIKVQLILHQQYKNKNNRIPPLPTHDELFLKATFSLDYTYYK